MWVYLLECLLLIWHLAELLNKGLHSLAWVLFPDPNSFHPKLSCLPGELQGQKGSVVIIRVCDGSFAWSRDYDETWKSCISVNSRHNREQRQTPTDVLNSCTPVCRWVSRTAEVTQKEILTLGLLRRCSLQISIKPGLQQSSSNENFTEDVLVILKCPSPALASIQSSRCAFSTAHSPSLLRWLTDDLYSISPKQNSWFSTYFSPRLLQLSEWHHQPPSGSASHFLSVLPATSHRPGSHIGTTLHRYLESVHFFHIHHHPWETINMYLRGNSLATSILASLQSGSKTSLGGLERLSIRAYCSFAYALPMVRIKSILFT